VPRQTCPGCGITGKRGVSVVGLVHMALGFHSHRRSGADWEGEGEVAIVFCGIREVGGSHGRPVGTPVRLSRRASGPITPRRHELESVRPSIEIHKDPEASNVRGTGLG
jgi:hypothetical protein